MSKNRREVKPADSFDPSRIYGSEKYALDNMLMRQVRFPIHYTHKTDFAHTVWSDMVPVSFEAAAQRFMKEGTGPFESGRPMQSLSEEDFVEFCRLAADCREPVSGARIVRFTHATSLYPVYRIDLFRKGPKSRTPLISGTYDPRSTREDPRKAGLEEMLLRHL
jgi:hypothetical protein